MNRRQETKILQKQTKTIVPVRLVCFILPLKEKINDFLKKHTLIIIKKDFKNYLKLHFGRPGLQKKLPSKIHYYSYKF